MVIFLQKNRMKHIALSSEIYQIRAAELQALPIESETRQISDTEEIIILLDEKGEDKLIAGKEKVKSATAEFLPVRMAYHTYPAFQAFFINLIKPIKRKFYKVFPKAYTTTLACILENDVMRGERNEANAYQWTNKKWQISREEAQKRYHDLYNSIKEHGYDKKSPMLIMLNRKFGVKDQILQGHHRIGICKSLNVKEVSISFWAVPKSFEFMKLLIKRKKS